MVAMNLCLLAFPSRHTATPDQAGETSSPPSSVLLPLPSDELYATLFAGGWREFTKRTTTTARL